ncbi:MAG TPA: YggT family protein [Gemmatimonadales bacterium]|nr:YggT family protein [Gemmatimonadales bacterium]HYT83292.1 YggT family protein [Gemmatimonadales bacterium]
MHDLRALARYAVFAAFAASVLIALASWLVRTRRVSPFSALGRAFRAASDPVIRPVETRLVRVGGNPINAGWWLVVVVAVVGLVLLSLMDWIVGTILRTYAAFTGGPRELLALLIVVAYNVLFFALMVRVIGAWFGAFRYSRWMRPVYALTDWLVEPIRRLLPPMGALDWSPLAAWLALWILKQLLLSVVML